MNLVDCEAAYERSGLIGKVDMIHDVVAEALVNLEQERDFWRVQAQDVLTDLHAAEADAAALRSVLIHGLGLANELGEGERWAAWRLTAHTVLSGDRGAALLAELEAARAVERALDETLKRDWAGGNWLPLATRDRLTYAIGAYDAAVKASRAGLVTDEADCGRLAEGGETDVKD